VNMRELGELIKAAEEGKMIQWYSRRTDRWVDCKSFLDRDQDEWERGQKYRIKPEPREFWIAGGAAFTDHKDALQYLRELGLGGEITHVREVLDEQGD